MEDKNIKIVTKGGRFITLKKLYEEHQKSHKEQANLPFEEKIKILIDLQKIAYSWGRKKDVIIWGE
ncbi:MAG: hypothetical protein HY738_02295 [Bacteroidia bacterium]|nr:hypothetical protein [Bacteroidia bacterium]